MEAGAYISSVDKIITALTSIYQVVSMFDTMRRKERQDTKGFLSVVVQIKAFQNNIKANLPLLDTAGAAIPQTDGISPPSFRADERS